MGIKSQLYGVCFPQWVVASGLRKLTAAHGIVLMYHEVLPDEFSLPAWTIVRESDFRWQMTYLREHFDITTMDQAMVRIVGKRETKRPFAVITFDDGYRGTLHAALPIMESMGLPFVVYVATQAIVDRKLFWHDDVINLLGIVEDFEVEVTPNDGHGRTFNLPSNRAGENRRWQEMERLLRFLKRMDPVERQSVVNGIRDKFAGIHSGVEMLAPEELKRLSESNCVTLGSHSHGHELLVQIQPEKVGETLRTANELITLITGYSPLHFAYPNGDYNQQVLDQVRQEGYVTAVTTRGGFWSEKNCLYEIPRMGIGRFEKKGQFKARISGFIQ